MGTNYLSVRLGLMKKIACILSFTKYILITQFWPKVTDVPSVWTKCHLYPSCTTPFSLDQASLMPFLHYTLQFWPRVTYALLPLYPSIWTKSLMPFFHYTLQFGSSVTYALLTLYPSVLTKSHLCPSSTIPFNLDQESLISALPLYPSVLTKSHWCPSCTLPFSFDQGSLISSCTILFNLDWVSLMPFFHYTLQF